MYPFIADPKLITPTTNQYGQPCPDIGDYVFSSHSGVCTRTVGVIKDVDLDIDIHDGAFNVLTLNGEIHSHWRYTCGILSKEQVQEIKEKFESTI